MGAHALGAAGYAAKAAALADSGDPEAAMAEVRWQVARLAADQRRALAQLPPLGSDRSGLLGAGLLTQGVIGEAIRALQAGVGAR